ncbi:hypothetical protein FHT36_001882, partial [Xanthobacter sp. SG618]|nr:hypothetical protein [Xanthobacter sp. SG618]
PAKHMCKMPYHNHKTPCRNRRGVFAFQAVQGDQGDSRGRRLSDPRLSGVVCRSMNAQVLAARRYPSASCFRYFAESVNVPQAAET